MSGRSPDWPPASLPGQERTLEATGDVEAFVRAPLQILESTFSLSKWGTIEASTVGRSRWGAVAGAKRVENGEVREGIMQTTTTPRIASLEPER